MISTNKISKGLYVGTDPSLQPEGTVIKNHNGQFLHHEGGSFIWKSAIGNEKQEVYIEDFEGELFETLGLSIMAMTAVGNSVYVLSVAENGNTYIGELIIVEAIIITASSGNNGVINPTGPVNVAEHTDAIFYLIPDNTYKIDDVTIDGIVLSGASLTLAIANGFYTFTDVVLPHTINVTFAERVIYVITPSAGANGSVNPVGATNVYETESLVIYIIPDSTYLINTVKIDGIDVPTITLDLIKSTLRYTFTNVSANHTFAVTFVTVTTYYISTTPPINGTIVPGGRFVAVPVGEDKAFVITPDIDYKIEEILIDGVPSVIPGDTYTFENVQANHNISVTFGLINTDIRLEIIITGSGTTVPSGGYLHTITYGSDLIIYFYPISGFFVQDLYINGVDQHIADIPNQGAEGISQFQINNVTEELLVEVTFDDEWI